jgi:hypothetical protein
VSTNWQVTVDCADPDALSRFWAAALGYEIEGPPEGFATWEEWLIAIGIPEDERDMGASIIDPEGKRARIVFLEVPEPKTSKNRLHLDLDASEGRSVPIATRKQQVNGAVDRLVSLGASRLRALEELDHYHVVMQDPEGNEFCLR